MGKLDTYSFVMSSLAVVCPNFIAATSRSKVVPVLGDQLDLDRLAEQRARVRYRLRKVEAVASFRE